MSIITDTFQTGLSQTASQNFTLSAPSDGTFKISRGNIGATTSDALTIDSSGNVLVTTQASSDASTKIATTAYVHSITDNNTGMRNRIINGNCNIAQRGTSISIPNSISTYGGPDRYIATNNSGGVFTQSQATLTYGSVVKNTVRQTVNTAVTNITGTNAFYGIQQIIEGYNAYDLLGNSITVSFIFNTNLTGTYTLCLTDSTSSHTYITTFNAIANTPTKIVKTTVVPTLLVIPNNSSLGFRVAVGILNTGTYATATVDSWISGTYWTASTQTNWGATAGNFIELTDLQLEKGNIATPFETRLYSIELSLCQRYFINYIINSGQFGGLIGAMQNSTNGWFPIYTPLRNIPNVTYSGNLNLITANVASPVTSVSNIYTSGTTYMVDIIASAATYTPGVGALLFSSSGFSYLNISAEL